MRKYFVSFEEASKIAKELGFKSQSDWFKRKGIMINKDFGSVPHHPERTYKNKGWISWGNFLGTNNVIGSNRKYKVDDDYFKTWSRNMAYILGLWWADGCIYGKTFNITLHTKDKYLLENILEEMKSGNRIRKHHRNNYRFDITSKTIVEDIKKIGGTYRKSMICEFPNIPKEFLSDFVRGYWDGDGSIFIVWKRKSYKSDCVSGSKKFTCQLAQILKENIPNIKPLIKEGQNKGQKNKYYRMVLGINDTRRLGEFIYSNNPEIKMIRKYERFLKTGEIKKDIRDRALMSYEETKDCIKKLSIKSQSEWVVFRKSSLKPKEIPCDPSVAYKNKGWISWYDFLGKEDPRKIKETL